ncbi:MAG: SPOR domain-containing protein [Neisseriaceae bacterium]|nr:SPOR domain-containing protein [Neisseriaceae bacterium]
MDTREEYEQLKRKNRNRLIGAIVLVAAIALILLAVTDKKTPPQEPEVKIAGKTQVSEKPADLPHPTEIVSPEKPAEEPIIIDTVAQPELPSDPVIDTTPSDKPITTPVEKKVEPKPAPKPVEKTEKKPDTKPAVKPAEKPQNTPEKAEKQPEKTAKPSPKDILEGKTSGNYFVQMGAFKTQAQADTQRAKLAQVGISSQIQQGKDKNGNTVYRVRSGSLNKADAEKIRDTAKNHKFDAMIVSQ